MEGRASPRFSTRSATVRAGGALPGRRTGGLDPGDHLMGLPVLGVETDTDQRRMDTEAARIREIPLLPAEDEEVEVADRSVGDDRNRGLESAAGDGLAFRAGQKVDLPVEKEGQPRQAAGARYRIDRAAERLVEKGRGRPRRADLPAAGALSCREFFLAAELSEVTLIDLEGVRQGHRQRFDVRVPCARGEVDFKTRVAAPMGRPLPADLSDRELRPEPERRAVDRMEVGGEVGHGTLIADPSRIDRERQATGGVDREILPV